MTHLIPRWGYAVRFCAAAAVSAYVKAAYRIRRFGNLPPMRGPAVVISNHQIDLDLMAIAGEMALHGGWRAPLYSASARMMHEPGFIAVRLPWLRGVLGGANLSWLFSGMGMLPIENQLLTRPLLRWAWAIERLHGPRRIDEIFASRVVQRFGEDGISTADLCSKRYLDRALCMPVRASELLSPYGREQIELMRRHVQEDLHRISSALRDGAIFYVTPEGEYSRDGKMLRFRGIWDALAPLAEKIYLAGISYDPFAPGRLSQLFRIVALAKKDDAARELAACRPVTCSAILSAWLVERNGAFTADEADRGSASLLRALPAGVFVDPEFASQPSFRIAAALRTMERLGIVRRDGTRYALSPRRRHSAFANVEDIVAFQAAFLSETLQANEPRVRVITGTEEMTDVTKSPAEHSHAI